MRSKRLQKTCEEVQRHKTKDCICQGFTAWKGIIVAPCDLPCDFVLESFTQAQADEQYLERRTQNE